MKINIDCKLLDEQIRFLDMYSSMITDEHKKGLVDGVANLLSEINYAVEENKEIRFVRVN